MSATDLLRWLTLLALLLAPLAMIGGSPAAAHARPAAAGHCAETEKPAEAPPSAPADCMIACAGCLPTQSGTLAVLPGLEAAARPAAIAFRIRGLHPEAATPPPRTS
ncbi:MAG TPA: hypothetical protein VF782_14095 [Allosphingosinicella sp.]|jgi:hypothetical protein